MYVYKRVEPQLWTAGCYTPSGKWEPESDHGSPAEAAARVHWLNGGSGCSAMEAAAPDLYEALTDFMSEKYEIALSVIEHGPGGTIAEEYAMELTGSIRTKAKAALAKAEGEIQ